MGILVTGAAGFIGMSLASKLLARDEVGIGIDSVNSYGSAELKRARLQCCAPEVNRHLNFIMSVS